jgi:3-oxoacyl-[acyl-carrier protein] reductase
MEAMTYKQYVLVTGGSGGIGSAVSKMCPSFGFTPIIGFKSNAEEANILAKEINGLAVQIDMSDVNSILNAIEIITKEIGTSGNLVAVVLGASPPPALEPFLKISNEQLSNQLNVNLIGPKILLQILIKSFFKKNKTGTIVGVLTEAIGSIDRPPATGMGSYVIAKIALKGMLSICSTEYPWLKIKTISPGFTKTPMLDVFDQRYLEMVHARTPILAPEDVATDIMNQIVS